MKTIRRIQNIMMAIGLFTAISSASNADCSTRDLITSMVIFFLVFSMIMYRAAQEESKRREEEL